MSPEGKMLHNLQGRRIINRYRKSFTIICHCLLQWGALYLSYKYVSFLLFISFVLYLIFELVSEGRYSLMRIIDNPFFAFVVYVISSVLLGCILHFIVKYIKNMCFNCS